MKIKVVSIAMLSMSLLLLYVFLSGIFGFPYPKILDESPLVVSAISGSCFKWSVVWGVFGVVYSLLGLFKKINDIVGMCIILGVILFHVVFTVL